MRNREFSQIAQSILPLMEGFDVPWGIAGGWALDLFLGRVTRTHDDLELAIFRQDQLRLQRHLHDWRFEKIVEGRREPWIADEELRLPVHEIHGHRDAGGSRKLEFLLNERDAENWIYRRNLVVTLPLDRAILQANGGLPFLAPEIVLLFKSKLPREKDEADFSVARAALDGPRKKWLKAALLHCSGNHRWMA